MPHEFTPAAERALAYAAQWRRAPKSPGIEELGPAELLLGLLAEPDCRAALLAATRGIETETVRTRWPELESTPLEGLDWRKQVSPEVRDAFGLAASHLVDYAHPHVLATEHLLLGLASGANEVAEWLATRGWDMAELAAEIDRLAGHDRGPLSIEPDTPLADALAPLPHAIDVSPGQNVGQKTVEGADGGEKRIADHEAIAQLRILDAAANRAGEAIRVIEDFTRFALDDRHLSGECKSLRHALTAALSVFPAAQRHAARETRADVGTTIGLATEQHRADLRAVVAANFKRFEQALRSLEEYAKPTSAPTAAALEHLRYVSYTLERAINVTADSVGRLATARLYVLIDGRKSAGELARWIDTLVATEVDMIQLRDKGLTDRELLARARVVRRQTSGSKTLFIMNDRPDMARLAGADGVHVGQDELGVKEARAIVGPDALVGVSTHSLQQAREAVLDGANYIGVGPVFPSRTKEFAQFPGLELLRGVSAEIRLPAFAIGGISADNVAQVRACGFDRVAVSSAVGESVDPADVVRQLKRQLA